MTSRKLRGVARAIPAFSARFGGGHGLSEDCIATLLKHARPLSLTQGTALYRQGQSGHGCNWVVRGLLKGVIEGSDGEAIVVGLYGPGDLIGSVSAIDGLPTAMTVVAISDCELTAIDSGSFNRAIETQPDFSRWLIAVLANRLRETYSDNAVRSRRVSARIAHALLKVGMRAGEPVDSQWIGLPFMLSHDALASLSGVCLESATRALGDWRKQGIIARSPRYPMLIQRQELEHERVLGPGPVLSSSSKGSAPPTVPAAASTSKRAYHGRGGAKPRAARHALDTGSRSLGQS